ncbi:MAG: hypothetical protein ALECFALPRED_002938, partial [Alectoria fallacina]
MKKHRACWPEAMMVITQARLLREKPNAVPSQRVIDILHNDIYQEQLEMWQACEYNIYEITIVNPSEPREKWIVEKVDGISEKKRDIEHVVQATLERLDERVLYIAKRLHRLRTVEEVEEEARRLSTIYEE